MKNKKTKSSPAAICSRRFGLKLKCDPLPAILDDNVAYDTAMILHKIEQVKRHFTRKYDDYDIV